MLDKAFPDKQFEVYVAAFPGVTNVSNDLIRKVAADNPSRGVGLVDAEAWLRSASPPGSGRPQ
jgi:hypothetical protein